MRLILSTIFLLGFIISCKADDSKITEVIFSVGDGKNLSSLLGDQSQISIFVDSLSATDSSKVVVLKMDDLDSNYPAINYVEAFLYKESCQSTPQTIIAYGSNTDGGYVLPQTFSTLDQGCAKITLYSYKRNQPKKLIDTFIVKLNY